MLISILLTLCPLLLVVGQGIPRGEMLLCEGDHGRIECGPNEVIYIYSAFYGRINKKICDYGEINTDKCRASSVTQKVKDTCDKRSFCIINAVSDIFGDPCPGTYKYFRVRFVCDLEGGPLTTRGLASLRYRNGSFNSDLAETFPRLKFSQKYHDVTF
ncbi:D-galactoside-specific lectin-like [Ylistrum balloti]|uniref:D-galactoside-specific lectin-like n=1 Tax=Ylistrum balloti TaxID=509963 RepID=UPI002905BC8B|nr:D-galactoside-specific lectin-like [Ylistrum balloti]